VPPDSAAADEGVAYAVYTAPSPSSRASAHRMLRATEENDEDDLFAALVAGRRSRLVSAAALAGSSGEGGDGDGSGGQNSGGVKVEGGANISPEMLVGKRVRVKWAGNRHFPGRISDYDPDEDKHTVCYDDGDVRQYRLQDKKFFLLPQQPTQPSTLAAAAGGAAAGAETGSSASSQDASATRAPAGLAAYLLGRTSGSSTTTTATGANTTAECHPTPNGARVGLRYTFEPTSRHAYHPRFQSGTIVRLLAFNHQRLASPLASEEALLDPNRGGRGTTSASADSGASEGMEESGVTTAMAIEESPELASAAGANVGAAGSGDVSGASGARSQVPPLRVQWDVTGLEADCHYEDLELIVPEGVASNEAATSSTSAADATSMAQATSSSTPAAADASAEGSNVAEAATTGTGGDKAPQTQEDGDEKKRPQGSSTVAPKTGQEKEEKELLVTVATCATSSTEPGESMLRVERSNWWSYGDQDGGAGSVGALLAYTDEEGVLHDKRSSNDNDSGGGQYLQCVAMPPLHALVKWPATSPLTPSVPPPADAGSSGAATATPSPTPMNAGHGATPNVTTAEYVDVYPIGHRGKFALQVHTPERAEFLAAAAQARRKAAAKQIAAKADASEAAASGAAEASASAGADSAEAAAKAAAAANKKEKEKEARLSKEKRVPRVWEVCLDHGWRPLPSDVAAVLENLFQRLKGPSSLSRRAGSGREDASSSESSSSSSSSGGGAGTAHLAEMGGTSYLLDVSHMTQRNVLTGTRRALRRAPKPPSHDTKTGTSQAGSSSSSGHKSSSSRRQQERASSRGHGKHAASQEATISPELVVAADGNALKGSDDALLGALPSYFLLMSSGQ